MATIENNKIIKLSEYICDDCGGTISFSGFYYEQENGKIFKYTCDDCDAIVYLDKKYPYQELIDYKISDRGSVSSYDFNISLTGISSWQTLDFSNIVPTGYTYVIMLAGLTTSSNGSGGQVAFSKLSGVSEFNVDIIKVNTASTTDYQSITVATNNGKISYIPSGDLDSMTIVVRGWM